MLFIPEIPVVLAFGLGATELIIILVIILIIFGAGKLPKVMQSLGTGIRSFKKAAREEEEEDTRKEKDNAEQAQIEEKEVKNLSSGEKVASEEATESKKKQEVEA